MLGEKELRILRALQLGPGVGELLYKGARLLPYRSRNTKPPELRFYALLSGDAREVRFERVESGRA